MKECLIDPLPGGVRDLSAVALAKAEVGGWVVPQFASMHSAKIHCATGRAERRDAAGIGLV